MTAGRKWLTAIAGLLLANIVATGTLIAASHHDASRVISDYYEHAVHYDDALEAARRDGQLGWRITTTIVSGQMQAVIHDRDDHPVTGASVTIEGYARVGDESPLRATLLEIGKGVYRAPVAVRGWCDVTVTVTRERDRYVARSAIEAR